MSEGRKLSDVSTTGYTEGLRLLAVDASGSVKGLNLTGLVEMIAATNSVLTVKKLSKQDLDANMLDEPMTLYMPTSDMTGWKEYAFENFPVRPGGGFLLITLPEGVTYKKQLYMSYASTDIYVRYSVYDSAIKGVGWRDWRKITPVMAS